MTELFSGFLPSELSSCGVYHLVLLFLPGLSDLLDHVDSDQFSRAPCGSIIRSQFSEIALLGAHCMCLIYGYSHVGGNSEAPSPPKRMA